MTESQTDIAAQMIVAKPAVSYRLRFGLMSLAFIALGLWFGYDGFFGYPAANAAFKHRADYHIGDPLPHTNMDILFQKTLLVLLPIAGLILLFWCFYRSRSQLRLEGATFHAPGHPPVDLNSITTINKKNWDRKGLAYLSYDQGGATGTIRIDDFAYERGPTDAIFKRIEEYLLPGDKK